MFLTTSEAHCMLPYESVELSRTASRGFSGIQLEALWKEACCSRCTVLRSGQENRRARTIPDRAGTEHPIEMLHRAVLTAVTGDGRSTHCNQLRLPLNRSLHYARKINVLTAIKPRCKSNYICLLTQFLTPSDGDSHTLVSS